MNTLEAYEIDINHQLREIPKLIRSMRDNFRSEEEQRRMIFTGAGDSYAAALIAVYGSEYRAKFIDPLELSLKPSLAKDSILYLISISGSTRVNIEAAKATKNVCKRVAITANPNSKLANICDEIIELKYESSKILTAGSISFTASLIAALSLVYKIDLNEDLTQIFNAAKNSIMLKRHVYIIGMNITYPLAIYAAAKIYEILGFKAQYCMLEEFCHMELFSLQDDTVLILSDVEKARMLYDKLSCDKHLIRSYSINTLSNILYYTFFIQLMVLNNAKLLGLHECNFINNKLRNISSSLIY